MSWHDPARSLEPESDSILRDELRGLLGMPAQPANYFESEPSPELIRLADDLRREARRRNHTARRRSTWMLIAAALPFALAVGGVGAWGIRQEHRADQLAAAVTQQASQIQQLAAAQAHPAPAGQAVEAVPPGAGARIGRGRSAQPPQTFLVGSAAHPKAMAKPAKGMELVIAVPRAATPDPGNTQTVKSE